MVPTLIICGILLFAVFGLSGLSLNTAYIPTPIDEASRLEGTNGNPQATPPTTDTPITKTATFAGTAYDFGGNAGNAIPANPGIGQPISATVDVTAGAAQSGSADETYTFSLQDSPDNSAWTTIGPAIAVTATGWVSIPGFRTQRYVRLHLVIAGTAPTISYDAWLSTQGFPTP